MKIKLLQAQLLSLLLTCLICSTNIYAFELKSLLGESSDDTKLMIGSLFYHSRDFIDKEYRDSHRWDNFRAALGGTYKGWTAYYFYTTHRQHSFSVGIERTWYHKVTENKQTDIGYRFGVLYGYCARNISEFEVFEKCDENSKYHFTPMGHVFYNHTWGQFGFELATAIMMSNASLIWRFN